VDGVWAAGNATNPRAQVITAAGEGSAVAIAINTELVKADACARHPAGAARPLPQPPDQPTDITEDSHDPLQNPPARIPPPSRISSR
jgi:hypothetical protein